MRHVAFGLGQAQALFNSTFYPHQAHAELVLGHFADAAHATVAKMVDVVDAAVTVADVDQHAQHVSDVLLVQHATADHFTAADATVELHATDTREIVAVFSKEQILEEVFRRFFGRRLARTHHAIDFDLRLQRRGGRIDAQRLREISTMVEIVGEDGLKLGDIHLGQLGEHVLGDFVIGARDNFAGALVDDVARQGLAHQKVARHRDLGNATLLDFTGVAGGDAAIGLDQHIAVGIDQIELQGLATQALGNQMHAHLFAIENKSIALEKGFQHPLGRKAQRAQQYRCRQLAAAVDAHVNVILGIKFKIKPRPAIGNDARREQQFARRMGLAAIVIEKYARRAVQLGDDDALSTIDDEGTVGGHERQFAHVDFLLADILDDLIGAGLFVVNHQTYGDTQ